MDQENVGDLLTQIMGDETVRLIDQSVERNPDDTLTVPRWALASMLTTIAMQAGKLSAEGFDPRDPKSGGDEVLPAADLAADLLGVNMDRLIAEMGTAAELMGMVAMLSGTSVAEVAQHIHDSTPGA